MKLAGYWAARVTLSRLYRHRVTCARVLATRFTLCRLPGTRFPSMPRFVYGGYDADATDADATEAATSSGRE